MKQPDASLLSDPQLRGRYKKSHYQAMTPMAAKVMRDLYFVGKLKQHELGRMFGRKQHSVSRIISGLVWS